VGPWNLLICLPCWSLPNSFHSIGCPSEWGLLMMGVLGMNQWSFHSIGCPSEWGRSEGVRRKIYYHRFPFNWVPPRVGPAKLWMKNSKWLLRFVSIQLGAPASGAQVTKLLYKKVPGLRGQGKFPFNWVPQRVGPPGNSPDSWHRKLVSIQLGAPASGALMIRQHSRH
jgi:hypothetical protein